MGAIMNGLAAYGPNLVIPAAGAFFFSAVPRRELTLRRRNLPQLRFVRCWSRPPCCALSPPRYLGCRTFASSVVRRRRANEFVIDPRLDRTWRGDTEAGVWEAEADAREPRRTDLRTSLSRRSLTSAPCPTATSGALLVRSLRSPRGIRADWAIADGNETSAAYYTAMTSTRTPSIIWYALPPPSRPPFTPLTSLRTASLARTCPNSPTRPSSSPTRAATSRTKPPLPRTSRSSPPGPKCRSRSRRPRSLRRRESRRASRRSLALRSLISRVSSTA